MQAHVWETGPRDAPALVFLHGGGLSGQALREQQLPRSAPVPVLVAVGQRETLPARYAARRLVASIPGARGVLVPAVGHLWNIQAPDLFTDTVRAWTTGRPLPPRLEPL